MTQATLNGKRIQMTIEEKARLLQVIPYETGTLAIRSNSDPRVAYAIGYDKNFHITSCACTGCKHHGRTHCAYRVAAKSFLHQLYRATFPSDFN